MANGHMKKCSMCHQSSEKWKIKPHTHQNGVGTLRMMWSKLHPSYTVVGLDTITPENSLAAPAEDPHTP